MSLSDTERAFVTLCCQPTTPGPESAELRALGPEHAKIWGVYRNMVRHRFLDEARHGLRRTRNAVGDEAFTAMFVRFMAEAPPRSRFFYDVVPAYARFAAPLWQRDDSVPAWTADLTRYEAARYSVADMPARRDRTVADFDFDRVPVLHDALHLLTVGHAVQREPADDGSYVKQETHLCIYRDKADRRVASYALSSFNADCVRAWQVGATVSESVRRVSEARAIQPDAAIVDALCTVLADFIERGVVRGSEST